MVCRCACFLSCPPFQSSGAKSWQRKWQKLNTRTRTSLYCDHVLSKFGVGTTFYQPPHTRWPAVMKCVLAVLRFLYVFCVCLFVGLCVPTYYICNNYIVYIVAVQFYFSWLQTAAFSAGIVTMSSLARLRIWDTRKQHRCGTFSCLIIDSVTHSACCNIHGIIFHVLCD